MQPTPLKNKLFIPILTGLIIGITIPIVQALISYQQLSKHDTETAAAVYQFVINSIITSVVIILFFTIYIIYYTKRKINIYAKEIEASHKALNIARIALKSVDRERLAAVIEAEEKERERLSKELHDGLGPLLSTIKLYVNEMISSQDNKNPENDEINKYALELIDEALNTTRAISNNLMPRVMTDYGLIKGIDTFCKRVNLTNSVKISFYPANYTKQDLTLELILYRVINELINNTIKHANATNIHISLGIDNDTVHLIYKDNGIGFNYDRMLNDAKSGIGLKNILSRLRSVNGIIEVNSNTGKGTEVNIQIKLTDDQENK